MRHKRKNKLQMPIQFRQTMSGASPIKVGMSTIFNRRMFSLRRFSWLLTSCLLGLFLSCQSDTKKPETPVAEAPVEMSNEAQESMPKALLLSIVDGKAVMSDSTFTSIPHYSDPEYTIFYCVRHAEKRKDQGDNPDLTPEGEARAKRLGIILSGERLDRAFSTNYKRTVQTAEIVRRHAEKVPAGAVYPANMQDAWLDETMGDSKGKHYLVVGHQNTIPQLLNRLKGDSTYQNLPDGAYNRFYIAVTKGIGQTEVIELRY